MSPEPPVRCFGRTRAQAARAALILALLGCGAIVAVVRLLTRPATPIGIVFKATGIPPQLILGAGCAAVLALAAAGYVISMRAADRFALTPEGLDVNGRLGFYTLAWRNIARVATTPTGALGISIKDREAVLETHRGTPQQREWLRTMEPFGEWDFLYPRADLGCPAEQVVGWVEPHLDGSGG